MVWGKRLLAFRMRHGVKQSAVADSLGVDERTVRRWETGDAKPNDKFATAIRALIAAREPAGSNKVHLHCNPKSCAFVVRLDAMLAGDVSAQGQPEDGIRHDCIGHCHLVHEEVVVRFADVIADAEVQRLKARFPVPVGKAALQAQVNYRFLRDMAEPLVIAECSGHMLPPGEEAEVSSDLTRKE